MAKGFYSPNHLWEHGYRIQNLWAWRINLPGKHHPRAGKYYPLTNVAVNFGEVDSIYVRRKLDTGEKKTQEGGFPRKLKYERVKYQRQWLMSFLVTIWFINQFNVGATVNFLRGKCGMKAPPGIVRWCFCRALAQHWGAVQEYMKGKFDIDINECIETQKHIIKRSLELDTAQSLGVAQNANYNLLKVAIELDENFAKDSTLKQVGMSIVDSIREKVKNESIDGGAEKHNPDNEPKGTVALSEGALEQTTVSSA